MMPTQNRIAGHLRLLGILWLAISAFRLIPGLVLFTMTDYGLFQRDGVPAFLNPLLEGVATAFLLLALAGIIAGWGLLTKQPWARTVAIALGAVNLIEIPFGTVLGIYTFWVLLPAESEQQYQRVARPEPA